MKIHQMIDRRSARKGGLPVSADGPCPTCGRSAPDDGAPRPWQRQLLWLLKLIQQAAAVAKIFGYL